MNNVEPRKYQNNVHFWLRKISYFIYHLPKDTRVDIAQEHPDPYKKGKDQQTELQMRENMVKAGALSYPPEYITKEEAKEACEKLYEMLNMPLDEDVLIFIEDPRCPGGRLRVSS